jgi:hypothetical protein
MNDNTHVNRQMTSVVILHMPAILKLAIGLLSEQAAGLENRP